MKATTTVGEPQGRQMVEGAEGLKKPVPFDSPLPPPRNLARDGRLLHTPRRSPVPLTKYGTETLNSQIIRTPSITRTPEASSPYKQPTPRTPAQRVAPSSPASPAFSTIYSSPMRTMDNLGVTREAESTVVPEKASRINVLSNPLPDTGSPVVNRVACDRLPEWTEALRQKLAFHVPAPTAILEKSPAAEKVDSDKARLETKFERKTIPADLTLIEFGISRSIDALTDNLRKWMLQKIIKPLSRDIKEVSAAFINAGLGHLSPESPATFSLFSRPSLGSNGIGNGTIMLSAGGFSAAAKPQTLLELSQKYPQDPVVQTRLRLERYLSFAGLLSQRVAIIRRLLEIAENGLTSLTSRYLIGGKSITGAGADHSEDDSQILMHLFCSFMDEYLPSENFYDHQPFSSRHFVAVDEKPSSSLDAVQIQQVARHPPYFRLIAGRKICEIYPGPSNTYHVIALLVEYLHREHHGFLGVGNLGSPALDLLSILEF